MQCLVAIHNLLAVQKVACYWKAYSWIKKVIWVVASLLLASYSTTLTLICSHTWEAVEESQHGITLSLRCRWKQSLFIGLCESLSFTSPLVETRCQSPIAMQAGSPQERPRQVLKQYVSVFVREWVCVRQWQKDWTCLFWFGCLSKSKIFSSFFPPSTDEYYIVLTRWKWFSLQTSHLFCPLLEKRNSRPIFEFLAKRKSVMNGSFGNICGHNHYFPSFSTPPLHQQTLAQCFHSSELPW